MNQPLFGDDELGPLLMFESELGPGSYILRDTPKP